MKERFLGRQQARKKLSLGKAHGGVRCRAGGEGRGKRWGGGNDNARTQRGVAMTWGVIYMSIYVCLYI